MSRFADPTARKPVDLGPCECSGTPHDHDEAEVRWQLSGSALKRIEWANTLGALSGDELAADRRLLVECLVSWNLVAEGPDGLVPVPITEERIDELDAETLTTISKQAVEYIREGQLPNASGALSAESSRESASPIPTPPTTPGT